MQRFLVVLVLVTAVLLLMPQPAAAQGTADDPYVGQIFLVGFNFAPQNFAFCDGSLLPISGNEVLFALIGTTYGGDGQTTFALPDLRGRVAIHMGANPSTGSTYVIGQSGGVEQVTLTLNQIPAHNHTVYGTTALANSVSPGNALWASQSRFYPYSGTPDTALNTAAVSATGGTQSHDNMSPYLVMNYIISLYGIFPSQN